MSLEKNHDRHNVLTVARESRLYREDGDYWLASGEGGLPVIASSGFATAVGELLADTPPALMENATDPETGRTGITITTEGEALFQSWATQG